MRRIGVRSETCTPRWVDSAMIGPAANRATAEGSRATNGARRARKVRKRRATMNRTESSSVSVWMWPFWFCSSVAAGHAPGQVHGQAGRCVRHVAKVDRSAATISVAALFPPRSRDLHLDERPAGPPVGRHPLVEHGGHPGHRAHGQLGPIDGGVVGRGELAGRGRGHEGGAHRGRRAERRGQGLGPDAGLAGGKELGVAALLHAGERGQGDTEDHGRHDPTGDDQPAKPYGEPSEGGEQADLLQGSKADSQRRLDQR